MYEQVFNFNARPFNSTPYVKHYFPATAMAQAVGQATICIQRGAGPVVAIGDIGTGKSVLLAKLATECQSEFQVVNIDCSQIQNGKELLQNILFQLGKPVNLDSETELRFAVIESANPTEESPEGILLLADDAETLTVDVLEAMRTLTNIVVEGSPRVRLVLAGRQPLEEQLADPSLASFSQRIASRVFLSNLSRDDTSAYVVEHINRVGGDGQAMFPNETIVKLHDLTDGCPRLINQVCDFVLILAATRGETNVSASLIEEAWNDVQSLPMASGRASTGLASSVAQTNENSDWTVIEFGQLDDDSPQPSNSTIYDFENPTATPETTSNDLLAGTEPLDDEATHEKALPEEPKQSTASEVDSDLGVDFAALQTMQNEAVTNDAAVVTNVAEEPATESTEATVQTSMEQELSAVFGTPVQSSGTVEATSDTANEPSESNPPLDDRSVKIDLANDASSIVGMAGIATTGIGSFTELASLTQQNSSVDDDSQPTTTELNDIDNGVEDHKQEGSAADALTPEPQSNQVVQETETSDLDSSPTSPIVDSNSFTPATQPLQASVESFSDVPGKPTTFDETSEQITTSLTNESLNQNGEGATIEFSMDAPSDEVKTPVEDPFDESFQAEEVISDQIIKNSGLHNRNALKLSSADLSQLTPLHHPTADQPPQVVQESSSDPANVDTDTLETETPHDVNDSLVSDSVNDQFTAETDLSLDSDAASIVGSASDQPLEDGADKGLSIVSEDSVFGADSTPDQSSDLHAEPTDSASPVASEEPIATVTSSDTSRSSESVQSRDSVGISDEISRQADEILARLQATSSELKQEQQILSDIREQQQIVNETQLSEEQSPPSVPTPDEPKVRDDSEMLIVPPSTPPVDTTKEPEVFPMTDSPISSGRAARMDYEKLFDRLRNQPDENKE